MLRLLLRIVFRNPLIRISLSSEFSQILSDDFLIPSGRYPSGEKFKSQHFDENLNPVWTDLTLEWDFSNLGMTQEFRLEVFDHDTIGSDDEIGFATFTLKDIAERHSHDDNPLELHLKTTKGVTVGRYALIDRHLIFLIIRVVARCICTATLCAQIL